MATSEEKLGVQQHGVAWLAEMELVQDPQLLNTIKLNILAVSPKIREVEILSLHLYGKKDMLIWVDLSFWSRLFWEVRLIEDTTDCVQGMLPGFTIRVVADYEIMRLAVKRVVGHFSQKKESV